MDLHWHWGAMLAEPNTLYWVEAGLRMRFVPKQVVRRGPSM